MVSAPAPVCQNAVAICVPCTRILNWWPLRILNMALAPAMHGSSNGALPVWVTNTRRPLLVMLSPAYTYARAFVEPNMAPVNPALKIPSSASIAYLVLAAILIRTVVELTSTTVPTPSVGRRNDAHAYGVASTPLSCDRNADVTPALVPMLAFQVSPTMRRKIVRPVSIMSYSLTEPGDTSTARQTDMVYGVEISVQAPNGSIVHVDEHPSNETVLPSSHCSEKCFMPSPQTVGIRFTVTVTFTASPPPSATLTTIVYTGWVTKLSAEMFATRMSPVAEFIENAPFVLPERIVYVSVEKVAFSTSGSVAPIEPTRVFTGAVSSTLYVCVAATTGSSSMSSTVTSTEVVTKSPG
eukprot:comp22336_c0_seq1/m.53711 comp22336_c0_seq1/g.53711  ORF comp22336_c0_seq1/g.53711 comp22336_c0_seq1/m.53711 type:complete len:353 (+) comp22336_c0_seq1:279-1337(+)